MKFINQQKGFTTFSSHERGFTLVEVLVAMTILSSMVVGTIFVVDPIKQINKAKDVQKQHDLSQIKQAMDAYYSDKKCYPTSIPFGQEWKSGQTLYMKKVPQSVDVANLYLYQYDTNSSCPQWYVVWGKINNPPASVAQSEVCHLTKLPNCVPANYDTSYSCAYAGDVKCPYLAANNLPVPTPTSAQPTPTPDPNAPAPTPTPDPVAGQDITAFISSNGNPNFSQMDIKPYDPGVGAAQTIVAYVKDSQGYTITSITVQIKNNTAQLESYPAAKISTQPDGIQIWQASFTVPQPRTTSYEITLKGTNNQGQLSSVTTSIR